MLKALVAVVLVLAAFVLLAPLAAFVTTGMVVATGYALLRKTPQRRCPELPGSGEYHRPLLEPLEERIG